MNKYTYLWVIQGYYGRWEDLSAYELWIEAKADILAYRENEGGRFRLIQRREIRT
jgi:hypothetical protein